MRARYAITFTALVVFFQMITVPADCARENSSLLCRQGEALALQGKISEAIDVFRKVTEISPYYALGHYGLGKAFLHLQGKREDAIKELRIAVELDPSLAKARFYLGMAYFFSDKYMPAIHAFSEAYRLDPGMIEALYNLGALYDIMEQPYHSNAWFGRYRDAQERIGSKRLF